MISKKDSAGIISGDTCAGSVANGKKWWVIQPAGCAFQPIIVVVIFKGCAENVIPSQSVSTAEHYVMTASKLTGKKPMHTGSLHMQIVKNTDDTAPCSQCRQNLAELGKFTYTGTTVNSVTQKDEECVCKNCEQHFILRYQYFDENGHVNAFVFNGDINDPTYNWQDQLTSEQRKNIGAHLKTCEVCMKKITEEALSDAWLASLIHNGSNGNHPKT